MIFIVVPPIIYETDILIIFNLMFATWPHKQTTNYQKGMEIQASNEDYLRDLKKNHKKKDKGVFGASQCDKHRKGKKV